MYERSKLRKQMTFYDRFYPEATQLQQTLAKEAAIVKENTRTKETIEEKMARMSDPTIIAKYNTFYQLPPQRSIEPDEEINAADHETHMWKEKNKHS